MDIYDTLVPVYWLSRFLGIAPLRIHWKTRTIQPFAGPITFFRLALIVAVFSFIAVEVEVTKFTLQLTGIALRVELYLGSMMTWMELLLAILNRKRIIRIINELYELDKQLKRVNITVHYTNARKFAFFQIIGIICVFSSKLIVQAFSKTTILILAYNVFNVIDFINTIMLFQYVDMLLLCRQRYVWLNRAVKSIRISIMDDKNGRVVNVNPVVVYNYYENSTTVNKLVREYGRIHNKLRDITSTIGKTYGVQLLITVLVRFIMVTIQLIYLYKSIRDPNDGTVISYTMLTFYLLLHSLKLFMIGSVSANTAAKARDTGIYLHTIWESTGVTREEIIFFSMQVLHQNPKYEVCGFFALDYALLTSIVGAISTYLIIIIQFDLNSSQRT